MQYEFIEGKDYSELLTKNVKYSGIKRGRGRHLNLLSIHSFTPPHGVPFSTRRMQRDFQSGDASSYIIYDGPGLLLVKINLTLA